MWPGVSLAAGAKGGGSGKKKKDGSDLFSNPNEYFVDMPMMPVQVKDAKNQVRMLVIEVTLALKKSRDVEHYKEVEPRLIDLLQTFFRQKKFEEFMITGSSNMVKDAISAQAERHGIFVTGDDVLIRKLVVQ